MRSYLEVQAEMDSLSLGMRAYVDAGNNLAETDVLAYSKQLLALSDEAFAAMKRLRIERAA